MENRVMGRQQKETKVGDECQNEERKSWNVTKQGRREWAVREKDVNLTQEDPGAVFVLGVPGHLIRHPELELTFIQLIDQLHFC